jgi:hypothetical protein
MSKNFHLNIHQVTSVTIGPVKERQGEDYVSGNRDILIETPDGTFEITLFSGYLDKDHGGEILEVKS